jgi:hypothetical protein
LSRDGKAGTDGTFTGFSGENNLPHIPALRKMMRNFDDDDARQPGHGTKIADTIRSTDDLRLEIGCMFPDREEINR